MALPTWRGRTSELAANKFHTRPHGCHGHRMLLLLLLPLLLLLLLHFSVSVSSSVRCGIICKMSLLVWILRSSKPRRSNWRSSGKAWLGVLGWGWVEVIHRRPEHVSLSLYLFLTGDKSETHSERQARCDNTGDQMIWCHLLVLKLCTSTRLVYHHQGWSWAYAIQTYLCVRHCCFYCLPVGHVAGAFS